MSDVHRGAFEIYHGLRYSDIGALPISDGSKMRLKLDWERNFETWQAAMRYRDEQARCECAYTCKFCRDEQEKGDGSL